VAIGMRRIMQVRRAFKENAPPRFHSPGPPRAGTAAQYPERQPDGKVGLGKHYRWKIGPNRCARPANGLRISRCRDAAGEARPKSQNHHRQNPTDGKCTPPKDATQAQGISERGW